MMLSLTLASLLLAACGDAADIAAECGATECPVGTAYDEYRAVRSGIDLEITVEDPTAYSGEIAFQNFGEGECQYTCVAIQACPEWTWPVITEDCFTCATMNEDGEVVDPEC